MNHAAAAATLAATISQDRNPLRTGEDHESAAQGDDFQMKVEAKDVHVHDMARDI